MQALGESFMKIQYRNDNAEVDLESRLKEKELMKLCLY